MTRSESASITVARRGSMPDDSDAGYTVIWVRGEHDLASKVALVIAIARAARRDEADLLVDLSEVTFMDASTIGALVGSRNRLLPRSQSLQLRAPSPPALRVLVLCGLSDLVHPAAVGTLHPTGSAAALGTWVDVPSIQPSRDVADATVPSEQRQPSQARQRTANARQLQTRAIIELDGGAP
jgi:anti-sigma B factor antagonist